MTTTTPWSPSETRRVLEDLQASGLSVAEFARQRQIAPHRVYWARRRARAAAKQTQPRVEAEFSEVIVADHPRPHTAPIELRLPSGITISVARDFDDVALRRVLGLLAAC